MIIKHKILILHLIKLIHTCVLLSAASSLSVSNQTNFIRNFFQVAALCHLCRCAEFMKDAGQGSYDRTYWDNHFLQDDETHNLI